MIRFSPNHIINRAGGQPARPVVERQQDIACLDLLDRLDCPVEHTDRCAFSKTPVVPDHGNHVPRHVDDAVGVLAVVDQLDSLKDHPYSCSCLFLATTAWHHAETLGSGPTTVMRVRTVHGRDTNRVPLRSTALASTIVGWTP